MKGKPRAAGGIINNGSIRPTGPVPIGALHRTTHAMTAITKSPPFCRPALRFTAGSDRYRQCATANGPSAMNPACSGRRHAGGGKPPAWSVKSCGAGGSATWRAADGGINVPV